MLARELKRRGEFAATYDRASAEHRRRQERTVSCQAFADLEVTLSELLDWYRDSFETIEESLGSHEALGVGSTREFLGEVMLECHTKPEHIPPAVDSTAALATDAEAFASRNIRPIAAISAQAGSSASGAAETIDTPPNPSKVLPATGHRNRE